MNAAVLFRFPVPAQKGTNPARCCAQSRKMDNRPRHPLSPPRRDEPRQRENTIILGSGEDAYMGSREKQRATSARNDMPPHTQRASFSSFTAVSLR